MPGKEVYLNYALDQIPRILGNMDRNSFSPTYGCFHRDYWLDKTSDFPGGLALEEDTASCRDKL